MLNFLTAFAGQKVRGAAQAATAALVSFDPKGATEAQISLMEGQLDELGKKVASTNRQYDDAKAARETAKKLNVQRMTAAEALQAQVTAGDASKEASLARLLDIIEQAQPELARLKQDEVDVGQYLGELQAAYTMAANKLRSARHDLTQAARGMERAKLDESRAKDRAETASIAAGVSSGGDALNTALAAMKEKTAAAQDAAAAANLKTSTLTPTDHEKDDPLISAAMADASGQPAKPQTVAERLAALKAA